MTQISIDPALAHSAASAIRNASDQLDSIRSGLSSQWFYLGSSWEGSSRDPVEASVRNALGNLSQGGEQTYDLGARLEAIATRFEEADEDSGVVLFSLFPSTNPSTTAGPFDWWEWVKWATATGGEGIGVLADVLKIGAKLPYKDYLSLGRSLNRLVGDSHAGFVGRMDNLGHLIKQEPIFGTIIKYGPAVSYLLGVASDLENGESIPKAVISQGIEWGIKKGIGKGLEKTLGYLIPGVGEAMLLYDGAFLVGHLAAGGAELLGFHDTATQLENTLDDWDVIGNVSDDIYDWGENYVTHPDKVIPDLEATAENVSHFGAGLMDGASDLVGNAAQGAGDLWNSLF